MSNLSDVLLLLPQEKFLLNLTEAVATRGQKKVIGSGYICHSDEGKLILKIINAKPPSKDSDDLNTLFNMMDDRAFDQTVIISSNDYYEFSGIDEFGNTVNCKHIDLDSDYEQRLYSATFQSNIWITSPKVDEQTSFDRATILIRNKYSFATNIYFNQNSPAGHLPRHETGGGAWQFNIDDITVTYYKNPGELQMDISAARETGLNDKIMVNMRQSLDFVMGLEHWEYFTFYQQDFEHYQAEISVRAFAPIRESYFTAPYRKTGSQGDEADVNQALFISYFNYIGRQQKSLLTKWHKRVVDSGTGYYFKHGLIAVAVEKILQEFYKHKPPPATPGLLIELKELESSLANYTEPTLVKNVQDLISKLSGKGSFIPGKRLLQLENDKVVSDGSQKSWSSLRNAYAHGTDYNDEMSKAIDLVRENVTIYYELIFDLIGYKGKYTNYFIKKGSPLTVYPPQTEVITK